MDIPPVSSISPVSRLYIAPLYSSISSHFLPYLHYCITVSRLYPTVSRYIPLYIHLYPATSYISYYIYIYIYIQLMLYSAVSRCILTMAIISHRLENRISPLHARGGHRVRVESRMLVYLVCPTDIACPPRGIHCRARHVDDRRSLFFRLHILHTHQFL